MAWSPAALRSGSTQVLARFAATALGEMELDKLTGALQSVVNETMQPAGVSLWLKGMEPSRGTKGNGHA